MIACRVPDLVLSTCFLVFYLFRVWLTVPLNAPIHRQTLYDEKVMASAPLRFLTVNARTKHSATVIFIHVG